MAFLAPFSLLGINDPIWPQWAIDNDLENDFKVAVELEEKNVESSKFYSRKTKNQKHF